MADLTSNQVCNICCIHYNAGLRCCALGSLVEGGYLFNKGGSIAWIVSCFSTQVSRTWASRANAVTVAQAANACGDWFVPSRTDLQLGYYCKSFWDSASTAGGSSSYWTDTEHDSSVAWYVRFDIGIVSATAGSCKTASMCVRAFRRVSY